jgi:hypothetical protein
MELYKGLVVVYSFELGLAGEYVFPFESKTAEEVSLCM